MVDVAEPAPTGPASEAKRLAQMSTAAFRVADASPDPALKADNLETAQALAGDAALAAAYTYLQRAVGVIAVLLPFTLAVGNLVLGEDELKGSISEYYYTPMGNVFVGSLCALAVFFLSYNYRPLPDFERDNALSKLASIAAIGVALFPTADDVAMASDGEKTVAFVHVVCACALFVLLAIFSLFLFTRTGSGETMTPAKRQRNLVYRICGGLIVGSIVLVILSNLVQPPESWHSLFWLETVGVVAFGVSWLVKGGFLGILADKKPVTPAPGPNPTPALDG